MLCPNCNTALSLAERKGIEIDFCPQCRGVWLDRGELDKIIERTVAEMGPAATAAPRLQPQPQPQPQGYGARPEQRYPEQRHYPDSGHGYGHGHTHRKKHKSFLSDLFDFD